MTIEPVARGYTPVLLTDDVGERSTARLVAAFATDEGFAVPLDGDRKANQALLLADDVWTVPIESDGSPVRWHVVSRCPLDTRLRLTLEAAVSMPLSPNTAVLELKRAESGSTPLMQRRPQIVAVSDASRRGRQVLDPARRLAEWFGLELVTFTVTDTEVWDGAGPTTTTSATSPSSPSPSPPTGPLADQIAPCDLVAVAAFGAWDELSTLDGLAVEMVEAGSHTVIAVGPEVAEGWQGRAGERVVIAVDHSDPDSFERLAASLAPLVAPGAAQPIAVHIVAHGDDGGDRTLAPRVAGAMGDVWRRPVDAMTYLAAPDESVADTLEAVVAARDAKLVVVAHDANTTDGQPMVASTSLEVAARCSVPVIIVARTGGGA